MSETRHVAAVGPTGSPRVITEPQRPSGWVGMIVFAGVILMLAGTFQAMMGLVALFDSSYYLVGSSRLAVEVDYTVWGWVHLVLGCAGILAGLGVLGGRTWARVAGIGLAVLALIVNVTFIPAYPVWSILLIVVDIIIIYALAVHGREIRSAEF
jgi:hypothetical protein